MSEMPIQKHPGGRPSKLTSLTKDKILTAVKCGASCKTACAAAGISEATFHAWKQKGEAPDAPAEYVEFLEALAQAKGEGNSVRLALIMKAARTDWRAAAWLLERGDPEHYSIRYKLEHSAGPKTLSWADMLEKIEKERLSYEEEGETVIDAESRPIEAPDEPEED